MEKPTCIVCGNRVRIAGQECPQCFFDRFTADYMSLEEVRKMRNTMDNLDLELSRLEFVNDNPGLFRVQR